MCRHFHAFLSSTALLCSPVNSIELVRRPALRCAVLLLCPSSAMLGFLSARSKGYSSPLPVPTKLCSPLLPCHLNSSKTLSGTGWMTIKFNEHKRINTMCIKATFQMDVHGGATSGLDWMDGSLGESTITMCMHH